MAIEIPLTQGQVAIIDDDDFERVSQYKWFAVRVHTGEFIATTNIKKPDGKHPSISMSRFLMGDPENLQVDHKDHNTLNNQKENLRVATIGQNTRNRRKFSNNRSGYKGVYLHKETQLYAAQITFQGKKRTLGRFTCPIQAAKAYNAAAMELHGEFAYLNNIEEPKIMKIDVNVPDGKSGVWEVSTFTVPKDDLSQKLSMLKYGRGVPSGTYKQLKRGGEIIMSNTPDEMRDFMYFVHRCSGSILINGLGLGVLLTALLEKESVTEITVIEKSEDVIKLVAPSFEHDKRVTIIHADAFEYKPPKGKRYNFVWHDIWDYICGDNLPEMAKLHYRYGRRCDYQDSWAKELCKRGRW